MALNYNKRTWVNGSPPALNASNLQAMDDGIKAASDRTDQQDEELNEKVDKVTGKGLSTNDYTSEEKTKLAGIAAGADVTQTAINDAVETSESTMAHWLVLVGGALKRMTQAGFEAIVRSFAATSQRLGTVLLGAAGGAPKLTVMPDAAAATLQILDGAWTTAGLFVSGSLPPTVVSGRVQLVGNGNYAYIRMTKAITSWSPNRFFKAKIIDNPNIINIRYDASTTPSSRSAEWYRTNDGYIIIPLQPAHLSGSQYINFYLIFDFVSAAAQSGQLVTIVDLWVGNSDLFSVGDIGVNAANDMSILANVTGAGAYATGVFTATILPPAGDNRMIGGVYYTYVDALSAVEGQVLPGSTIAESLLNWANAINADVATFGVTHYCSRENQFVSAIAGSTTLTVRARNIGSIYNKVLLAVAGASGSWANSNLTGGIDAIGAKIKTQMQTLPATENEYGASKLAPNGCTTAGLAVQANDSRLATAPATWTPVLNFGGVADDGTYIVSLNNYMRSGKMVHAECIITWMVSGTKTGDLTITGVPVAANTGSARPSGVAFISTGGVSVPGTILVSISSATLYFHYQNASGITTLTKSLFTASTVLRLSLNYIAA